MIVLNCPTLVSMISPFMGDHMEPTAALALDRRCALGLLSQRTGPSNVPARTCTSIVMDSPPRGRSRGPAGFDVASLAELIESASYVGIVAGGHHAEVYDRAAQDIEVGLSTVIVETTPRYQAEWARFVLDAAPNRFVEELPLSRLWWPL